MYIYVCICIYFWMAEYVCLSICMTITALRMNMCLNIYNYVYI